MPTRVVKVLGVLAFCVSASALAGKSVTVGKTYSIAEPDLLDEIKRKAAAADFGKWARKAPAEYTAFQSAALPRVRKTESHLFDPTYILPDDIRDATGKLIAPKGLPINVYTRIKVPGRYIVIADTPEDFQWLRDVAKPVSGDKILLAGGNVLRVRERTSVPVFLLDPRFIERFGLRAVPSVVQQEGNRLRVSEYLVELGKGVSAPAGQQEQAPAMEKKS